MFTGSANLAGLKHPHWKGPKPQALSQWRRLDFAGVSHPVILPEDAPLLEALSQVMRGWAVTTTAAPGPLPDEAAGTCLVPEPASKAARYRLHSSHLDAPLSDLPVASAVCGILADLAQSWFSQRGNSLALHCAAARIGGQLVAFAGSARAGKSTLAARLTAERDFEVFCDDVLPLDTDGTALALGTAPRLRLPLPTSVSQTFRTHVQKHLGPSDGHYGYIITDTVAPHGTQTPLAALVILDRRAAGPARLHKLEPGEAAGHLLKQNMTSFSRPDAALDSVERVAEGLICARLVYSDLEEAVQLLRATFSGSKPPPFAPPDNTPGPADLQPPAVTLADPDEIWHRVPDATIRRVSQAAFVWRLGEGSMWHLNPVAEAVWVLLEIPGSARDLADALAHAFPKEHHERLLQDTRRLLATMQKAGLIEGAGKR